jgi:hypothetical protein
VVVLALVLVLVLGPARVARQVKPLAVLPPAVMVAVVVWVVAVRVQQQVPHRHLLPARSRSFDDRLALFG